MRAAHRLPLEHRQSLLPPDPCPFVPLLRAAASELGHLSVSSRHIVNDQVVPDRVEPILSITCAIEIASISGVLEGDADRLWQRKARNLELGFDVFGRYGLFAVNDGSKVCQVISDHGGHFIGGSGLFLLLKGPDVN